MARSVCVLVSGGLDSDVLLAEMAKEHEAVFPVYIEQGLRWEKTELYWLRRFLSTLPHRTCEKFVGPASCRPGPSRFPSRLAPGLRPAGATKLFFSQLHSVRPLTILSLPMSDVYEAHWSLGQKPAPGGRTRSAAVYLPGRNLALTVKAAVFCALKGIPEVAIGSLDHNPFPDATPAFFELWSKALSRGLAKPLRLSAPFRFKSKAEVIRRGSGLPLHLSFSCLSPKGLLHCGRCNKCAERRRAFREAGVGDRTNYCAAGYP